VDTKLLNKKTNSSFAFSFGDPEPVLNTSPVDYLGVFLDGNDKYYAPPIDLNGLARLMGANPYHGPILHFKKNMIVKWFKPHPLLSSKEFAKLALNFVATGNCYTQKLSNPFNQVTKLINQPSVVMRRGKKQGDYLKLKADLNTIEFKHDEIMHLSEYDLRQDIYGVPEYIGGIQSVLLTEDMTLFRRKYIINGQHMGYILVTNDADIDEDAAEKIGQQVKQSKGPGNGRSMYINIGRSSSKEPVQIIPVGNIGTKDDYEKIKGITEREMLAMHRMQPALSGVIPEVNGGYGDIVKMREVYHDLEITAMQAPFLEINEVLGREVVAFDKPEWLEAE